MACLQYFKFSRYKDANALFAQALTCDPDRMLVNALWLHFLTTHRPWLLPELHACQSHLNANKPGTRQLQPLVKALVHELVDHDLPKARDMYIVAMQSESEPVMTRVLFGLFLMKMFEKHAL